MSIYSANRSGSMNLSQVRANESYTSNDLGRILCESQMNDMAFFEAILASDFREIQSLREGTLLESEIKSINEASFRTIIASLKTRLMEFWAKIKAAFKDAMTKIAAYVLRDGKAFVKNFWATYNKYKGWSGSIPNVKRYPLDGDVIDIINEFPSEIEGAIKDTIQSKTTKFDGKSKNDIIKQYIKDEIGDIEPSDFVKKMKEEAEETITVSANNLKELCKVVSEGNETINRLKKAENKAKNTIDKMGKALTDAENKSGSNDSSKNISTIVTLVGVGESLVTYTTRACIAIVKADIKSCRSALGSVMSDLRTNGTKKDKDLKESYILEAEDEVEAAFSTDPDELDIDTQDAVDDLIAEEI